jgi:hypothetical protein
MSFKKLSGIVVDFKFSHPHGSISQNVSSRICRVDQRKPTVQSSGGRTLKGTGEKLLLSRRLAVAVVVVVAVAVAVWAFGVERR